MTVAEDELDPTQARPDAGPTDADLRSLADLAQRQVEAENQVIEATRLLQLARDRLFQISNVELPQKMEAVGMASFSLTDGQPVSTKIALDCKQLTDAEGLAYVEESGNAALIKTQILVEFDAEDYDEAVLLYHELKQHRLANRFKKIDLTKAVHPQTLGAFVRQLYEAGKDPPLKTLGVFRRVYAVVGKKLPKSVELKGMLPRTK